MLLVTTVSFCVEIWTKGIVFFCSNYWMDGLTSYKHNCQTFVLLLDQFSCYKHSCQTFVLLPNQLSFSWWAHIERMSTGAVSNLQLFSRQIVYPTPVMYSKQTNGSSLSLIVFSVKGTEMKNTCSQCSSVVWFKTRKSWRRLVVWMNIAAVIVVVVVCAFSLTLDQ